VCLAESIRRAREIGCCVRYGVPQTAIQLKWWRWRADQRRSATISDDQRRSTPHLSSDIADPPIRLYKEASYLGRYRTISLRSEQKSGKRYRSKRGTRSCQCRSWDPSLTGCAISSDPLEVNDQTANVDVSLEKRIILSDLARRNVS
jgi:hypothetical protein